MWNTAVVGSVQSVERAFAVLHCLAAGPAGVTELAERADLPKSTVSRLLATLHELGAVEQASSGADYRIGPAVIALAGGAGPTAHLVSIARPHLVELARQLDEATGLSVRDGDRVHYLDQVDGEHAVQVRDWTGEHVPLHLVPSGLVLLAAADADDKERYLSTPMAPSTSRSVIDTARVRRRLSEIESSGVEWVYEEFAEGINSVAATVRDDNGVVAAVHAHGPSYRFPGQRSAAEIASLVVAAADRISARLSA
jgi:DNA-binding IclR family transcriptional regulator